MVVADRASFLAWAVNFVVVSVAAVSEFSERTSAAERDDPMTTNKLAALPTMPKMPRAPKAKTNLCGCGCGQLTGNTFVPGHDSRLRGWALRISRDLPTTGITDGEKKAAKAFLAAHGGIVPTHARVEKVATKTVNKPTDKKMAKKADRAAKLAKKESDRIAAELAGSHPEDAAEEPETRTTEQDSAAA